MGADVGTLVTLDTVVDVPHGDEGADAALLVGSGARGPCAVDAVLEGADGQQIAVLGVDGTHHLVDESRLVLALGSGDFQRSPSGVDDKLLVFASAVHSGIVLINDVLTLLAVALDDELLHLLHGEVHGDDAGDAEEGTLQDGVRAVAKSDFLSNLRGVDVIDLDVVLSEVLLHLGGEVLLQLVALPDGVEEERAVLLQAAGDVVHVQIGLYVAGDEVGGVHQIGAADGAVAEAQVRAGEAARLLRVVREVGLAMFVGVVADDFDGVLVGTHGTVGTEAVELGFEHPSAAHGNLLALRQRGEGDVVHDADGEAVLGLCKLQVGIDGQNLCGGGVV